MLKRNLWKLVLSVAIAVWAVSELIPLHQTPFPIYARAHATARQAEFSSLMDEAAARHKADASVSEYVGLRNIAKERRIDLSKYYPDIPLENSLTNLEKRNDI